MKLHEVKWGDAETGHLATVVIEDEEELEQLLHLINIAADEVARERVIAQEDAEMRAEAERRIAEHRAGVRPGTFPANTELIVDPPSVPPTRSLELLDALRNRKRAPNRAKDSPPPHGRRPLPDAVRERILKWTAKGLSGREVAEKVGVSPAAVQRVRTAAGVSLRPKAGKPPAPKVDDAAESRGDAVELELRQGRRTPDSVRAEIRKMKAAGESNVAIAKKTGLNRMTVANILLEAAPAPTAESETKEWLDRPKAKAPKAPPVRRGRVGEKLTVTKLSRVMSRYIEGKPFGDILEEENLSNPTLVSALLTGMVEATGGKRTRGGAAPDAESVDRWAELNDEEREQVAEFALKGGKGLWRASAPAPPEPAAKAEGKYDTLTNTEQVHDVLTAHFGGKSLYTLAQNMSSKLPTLWNTVRRAYELMDYPFSPTGGPNPTAKLHWDNELGGIDRMNLAKRIASGR